MIKVNFKELRKSSKDLGDQLRIQTANGVAEQFADHITNQIKNLKCESHPNSTRGTIEVKADMKKMILINKTNFCCTEMKNSIDIPIKR